MPQHFRPTESHFNGSREREMAVCGAREARHEYTLADWARLYERNPRAVTSPEIIRALERRGYIKPR